MSAAARLPASLCPSITYKYRLTYLYFCVNIPNINRLSIRRNACFRPARRTRSLTIEHPTRIRIPSDQREPRDLSSHPARTCGELAEPIGISGFGSPLASAALFNCLTPGESYPYSRSPSKSFHVMLLRTLPFSVYYLCHSKFFAFNRLRTLSQNRGVGINSSQSGTLAPSSTNHESQVTNHE